jgi:hypothetical protein
MSTNTLFLNLEQMVFGEYPGTWGDILNSNFVKTEAAIKALYSLQASADDGEGAPSLVGFIDLGAGTPWYDITADVLKIKNNAGNFISVIAHQHGVTPGAAAIDLSTDIDTESVLPSANVQYTNLDAEYLGHIKHDQYVTSAGTGIEKTGQALGLEDVDGLVPGEANLVIVDAKGRVTSATKVATSAGLGLTDVLTIVAAQSTYYNKTEIDDVLEFNKTTSQNLVQFADARYGSKDLEHEEVHNHDTVYAKINGDATKKFVVADINTDLISDLTYAMSKGQLDTRFLLKIAGIAQEIEGEVKFVATSYYDPTDAIDGGATASDYEIANKKYVDDNVTTLNTAINTKITQATADAAYHPKNGGVAPYSSINVPDPGGNTNGAVPLQSMFNYVTQSITSHEASGHTQYDTLDIPVVDEAVSNRNCILQAPLNSSGVQNWYNVSGLVMQIAIPDITDGRQAVLRVTAPDGYGGLPGQKDKIIDITEEENWVSVTSDVEGVNKLTFPASSAGFFGVEEDESGTKEWFYIAKAITSSPFNYEQAAVPASPSLGQTWFDTAAMKIYRWEYDADAEQNQWNAKSIAIIGTYTSDSTTVTLFPYKIRQNKAEMGMLKFNSYTVSTVPSAANHQYCCVVVSDESGGACVAFSDGTNWKRIYDNAVIS